MNRALDTRLQRKKIQHRLGSIPLYHFTSSLCTLYSIHRLGSSCTTSQIAIFCKTFPSSDCRSFSCQTVHKAKTSVTSLGTSAKMTTFTRMEQLPLFPPFCVTPVEALDWCSLGWIHAPCMRTFNEEAIDFLGRELRGSHLWTFLVTASCGITFLLIAKQRDKLKYEWGQSMTIVTGAYAVVTSFFALFRFFLNIGRPLHTVGILHNGTRLLCNIPAMFSLCSATQNQFVVPFQSLRVHHFCSSCQHERIRKHKRYFEGQNPGDFRLQSLCPDISISHSQFQVSAAGKKQHT